MKKLTLLTCLAAFSYSVASAQIDEDQLGAWYMLFWSKNFNESNFGMQGDYQFRNWNLGSDLEQILLRTGFTYQNDAKTYKFTLGYGYISTGEFGDGNSTVSESRIYQEMLIPHKVTPRIHLVHRFRYEQRWVENQDTRTRYRYNLFVNIPLNNTTITKGTYYLALYNELFVNGQRDIGDERMVELFDRNRTYGALGYGLSERLRLQLGIMRQATDNWAKNQLQLSAHASW